MFFIFCVDMNDNELGARREQHRQIQMATINTDKCRDNELGDRREQQAYCGAQIRMAERIGCIWCQALWS